MCKDEHLAYRYGNVEDLDIIDSKSLYDYYLDCLAHCPIDLFVLGDVDEEEIQQLTEEMFSLKKRY